MGYNSSGIFERPDIAQRIGDSSRLPRVASDSRFDFRFQRSLLDHSQRIRSQHSAGRQRAVLIDRS